MRAAHGLSALVSTSTCGGINGFSTEQLENPNCASRVDLGGSQNVGSVNQSEID